MKGMKRGIQPSRLRARKRTHDGWGRDRGKRTGQGLGLHGAPAQRHGHTLTQLRKSRTPVVLISAWLFRQTPMPSLLRLPQLPFHQSDRSGQVLYDGPDIPEQVHRAHNEEHDGALRRLEYHRHLMFAGA
jgi:hypothetical protein